MAKYIGVLIFSLLLILANSKPSKRKNRDSDSFDFEEKVEETTTEEKNFTLFTVLTEFSNFYEDIMPELNLTLNTDCENSTNKFDVTGSEEQQLAPGASLDCLTLDAVACAVHLKDQFNVKVKEVYIRGLKSFITKIFETYTAISEELPENDAHQKELQHFLNLISTDLPKLNTELDLDYLNRMFQAMHDDLKPKFVTTKINNESQEQYEKLVGKHRNGLPSKEEINNDKNAHINKIWKELMKDLRGMETLKRL